MSHARPLGIEDHPRVMTAGQYPLRRALTCAGLS